MISQQIFHEQLKELFLNSLVQANLVNKYNTEQMTFAKTNHLFNELNNQLLTNFWKLHLHVEQVEHQLLSPNHVANDDMTSVIDSELCQTIACDLQKFLSIKDITQSVYQVYDASEHLNHQVDEIKQSAAALPTQLTEQLATTQTLVDNNAIKLHELNWTRKGANFLDRGIKELFSQLASIADDYWAIHCDRFDDYPVVLKMNYQAIIELLENSLQTNIIHGYNEYRGDLFDWFIEFFSDDLPPTYANFLDHYQSFMTPKVVVTEHGELASFDGEKLAESNNAQLANLQSAQIKVNSITQQAKTSFDAIITNLSQAKSNEQITWYQECVNQCLLGPTLVSNSQLTAFQNYENKTYAQYHHQTSELLNELKQYSEHLAAFEDAREDYLQHTTKHFTK